MVASKVGTTGGPVAGGEISYVNQVVCNPTNERICDATVVHIELGVSKQGLSPVEGCLSSTLIRCPLIKTLC